MKTRPRTDDQPVSFVAACLCASVVLCVVDGAIRKWIYQDSTPSFQAITYFSKDVPLVLALAYSIVRGGMAGLTTLRTCLILGTFAIVAGSAVSMQGLSQVGAVVSLRGLLFLPWFAYVCAPHCDRPWDLHAVGTIIVGCAIVNAVLGASQFALPADHFLNQTPSSAQGAIGDVGRIRASGTFGFISGLAAMCLAACWVGTALVLRNRASLLGYAGIVSGFACTSAAVSRSGAVVGFILVFVPLLLKNAGRVLIAVFLALSAVLYMVAGEAMNEINTEEASLETAVMARSQTQESFDERAGGTFTQVPDAIRRFPLGTGLGRAQASAAAVADIEGVYEFELARIVYEIGLLGLLGTVIIRAGFLLEFREARVRRSDPACAATGLAFSGLSLVLTLVFDHNAATFWAVAMTVCLGGVRPRPAPLR